MSAAQWRRPSQRTHGDAEVGAGQNGRVVDAVAHEGEVLFRAFGGEERFDLVHLVARQQTGMVFVQTQLIGDRSGYRFGVAGQHHGLADACGLQAPDGLRAVGLDHVRDEQITGILPLDGHMHEVPGSVTSGAVRPSFAIRRACRRQRLCRPPLLSRRGRQVPGHR